MAKQLKIERIKPLCIIILPYAKKNARVFDRCGDKNRPQPSCGRERGRGQLRQVWRLNITKMG